MTLRDNLLAAHEATGDQQTLETARIYLRDESDVGSDEWEEVELDELDAYDERDRRIHLRVYTSVYIYTTPLTDDGKWRVNAVQRDPRLFSKSVVYEFPS